MNASKENAEKAIDALKQVWANSTRGSNGIYEFMLRFLVAAQRKLPYERSFPAKSSKATKARK